MSSNDRSKDIQPLPAITNRGYSNRENEVIPSDIQPRPPRNLQDLLRYTTEATNALGNTTGENLHMPLDEESKKFLEDVLKSMTVDVVEELLKSIRVLQKAHTLTEDDDPTECEEALDHIFDNVDNLDVANDFHKIGGFCVFNPCLESVHSSLRWRGAELIAELCQNNPYCQGKVLEMDMMPKLLKMIDLDESDIVKIKALYAVSCLARASDAGLQEFLKSDGFSTLLRALQSDIQKLTIKSAFLLSSLCQWKPDIKDELVSMGYVEQLISQLAIHVQKNDGHTPDLEHILNALLVIMEDFEPAQNIGRKPELQFKALLEVIVNNSEENDQYEEENEYAKKLLAIIFGQSEDADEDR